MAIQITTKKNQHILLKKGAIPLSKNEWIIPDNNDINLFLPWIDIEKIDLIAKAPINIATTTITCDKCRTQTKIISFFSDNFYTYDHMERQFVFEDGFKSFLSDITFLPPNALQYLKQHHPTFKQVPHPHFPDMEYYSNHCEHCGTYFDDHYLHMNPGYAFCPNTDDESNAIELTELPLEFDLLIGARHRMDSNQDEIFAHLKRQPSCAHTNRIKPGNTIVFLSDFFCDLNLNLKHRALKILTIQSSFRNPRIVTHDPDSTNLHFIDLTSLTLSLAVGTAKILPSSRNL